jgi:hypothetical protein
MGAAGSEPATSLIDGGGSVEDREGTVTIRHGESPFGAIALAGEKQSGSDTGNEQPVR